MNKKQRWSFYIVTTGASQVKQIFLPRIIVILFAIAVIASSIGFVHSAYVVAKYGYARFGLYDKRIDNRELKEKIKFLNKLADAYNIRIKTLVAYEDKARLKFGMNTISEDIREAGVGGPPSLEQLANSILEDQDVRQADELEQKFAALLRQVSLQDSTFSRMTNHIEMQNDRWAQRPAVWPCRGRITSGFGNRYHPFLGTLIFHEGLDIANEIWTPIVASADGIVSFTGYRGNYGTSVMINHRGSGYVTVYAHLVKTALVEGQVVRRGEIVGYLGDSGRSTGPHLHYEVRKFNKYENPMKYILPMDFIVD